MATPDYWKYTSKNTGAKEAWCVRLYYDAEGSSDYLGISTHSLSGYYPLIKDVSGINKKIDLVRSKGSVGDIRITCINRHKNLSLAEELAYGTRYYINHKVNIYSSVGGNTTVSDMDTLGEYRLSRVEQRSTDEVDLYLTERRPDDKIIIPTSQTNNGTPAPVVYGNYTKHAADGFQTGTELWPAPFDSIGAQDKYRHIVHTSNTGDATPHKYIPSLNIFSPYTNSDTDTSSFGSFEFVYYQDNAIQYRIRPTEHTSATDADWTNPENAYDDDNTSYTDAGHEIGVIVSSVQDDIVFNFPDPPGTVSDAKLLIKADAIVSNSSGFSAGTDDWYSELKTSGGTRVVWQNDADGTTSTSGAGDGSAYDEVSGVSTYSQEVTLEGHFVGETTGGSQTFDGEIKIYDIYYLVTITPDETNEIDANSYEKNDTEFVYCAIDGFDKGYSGGSGTATLPHEIHRDMLQRFASFDPSTATGFSDLNTDRSGWTTRLWILEYTELRKVLEMLQFEGCFVWVYENGNHRYIHVKDSYSSSDVQHTLDPGDYESIDIKTMPFSEIITKTTYNYEKHPGSGKYLNSDTYTNSTSRTNYWASVGSTENTETKNLEYLTTKVYSASDTDPNDNLSLYYDNIKGEPKIIVNAKVTNLSKTNITCGDIVKFDDDARKPFAKSWSSLYFMVTSTRRNLNQLEIEARLVYES